MSANRDGLFVDGIRVVARDRIKAAAVVVRPREVVVELAPAFLKPVEVVVASHAEGHAVLEAMQLDPRSFAGRYWTRAERSVPTAFAGIAAAIALPFIYLAIPVGVTLLITAAGMMLAVLRAYYRSDVGADGVYVRRLLARPRFIPYAEMSSTRTVGATIVLSARNGTTFPMVAPSQAVAEAMTADIEDRRAAARNREELAASAKLRRGQRPVEAWLGSITAPGEPTAYRQPAIPASQMWRVLEDPAAPPTARAAAAFALRSLLDEEGRLRLVRIAASCAAPPLRVALDRIASEADDDAVSDALEPLEDRS